MIRQPKSALVLGLSAVYCFLVSSTVQATAYSLYAESSILALSNFAAGSAAEAVDASTAWYNPAGLVRMKHKQFIVSGIGVVPNATLSGTSVFTTLNPLNPTGAPLQYEQSFTNLEGADNGFIPAVYYASPIGENAAFGVSVVAPYGLATHYTWGSPVRYQGTLSKFYTMDVSPELAVRLTDNIAFGGGIDFQYSRVLLNSMVGSPALIQAISDLNPTLLDSNSKNTGNSFAIAAHAGILFMFNDEHTRLGVDYTAQSTHIYSGFSQLTGRLADPTLNVLEPLASSPNSVYNTYDLNAVLPFPNIVTISGYQDINDKWAILGSAVFFGWSAIQQITLNNVAFVVPQVDGSVAQVPANVSANQGFRNTWRGALGANYNVNNKLQLRAGGGYDQTPTVLAERDTRLPDTNRWAVGVGGHYQWTPALAIDVAYSHFFSANPTRINKFQAIGTSANRVTATGRPEGDLFGAQLVWSFDSLKPLADKVRSFVYKT